MFCHDGNPVLIADLVQTSLLILESMHFCFRLLFDHVTRINLRFRFWLHCHLHMALLHLPNKFVQISLFHPVQIYQHIPKFLPSVSVATRGYYLPRHSAWRERSRYCAGARYLSANFKLLQYLCNG